MIYGHTVKKDGVIYHPGEEVPETSNKQIETETPEKSVDETRRRGRPKSGK